MLRFEARGLRVNSALPSSLLWLMFFLPFTWGGHRRALATTALPGASSLYTCSSMLKRRSNSAMLFLKSSFIYGSIWRSLSNIISRDDFSHYVCSKQINNGVESNLLRSPSKLKTRRFKCLAQRAKGTNKIWFYYGFKFLCGKLFHLGHFHEYLLLKPHVQICIKHAIRQQRKCTYFSSTLYRQVDI
jgi:hypothetical protein